VGLHPEVLASPSSTANDPATQGRLPPALPDTQCLVPPHHDGKSLLDKHSPSPMLGGSLGSPGGEGRLWEAVGADRGLSVLEGLRIRYRSPGSPSPGDTRGL
jgi:hypothetical protein